MKLQRISVQTDVSGIEPEMILVFETRGLIQDFFKAVRKIPELEWLGEMEKNFDPDDFFYYENSDKQLRGKVYFVLTNYRALQKILTLWSRYKYGHKFDHGTNKWRDLFALLYEIRTWNVLDRVGETGILKDWTYRIENDEELIPFEIELWYRKSATLRTFARDKILVLLEQFDGEILSESVIDSIAYHGILARAPIQIFNELTENTDIGFFKATDIMFLRPVGQCSLKLPEEIEVQETEIPSTTDDDLLAPVVALLDGLPMQNHRLLAARLEIDDPDNFSQDYIATARLHGTAMSSVVIYGDLNENNEPIKSRVYVRPIMKNTQTFKGNAEQIPEDVLIVDLIHRAVHRMFEKEGDLDALAPTIKVINLSMGDPFRIFDNAMSSWAKLLDWLSYKYNVLFIVSAGNCSDDLDFSAFQGSFNTLVGNATQLKNEVIKTIFNNNRHRKIIAPAESINAITVGASDHDSLDFQVPNERVLLTDTSLHLSPSSRMGLGHNRSIKPEVIVPGGRVLFRQVAGQPILTMIESFREPGIKVAAPSANGSLSGTLYSRGTSNAAGKLSYWAAKLYENYLDSGLSQTIPEAWYPLIAKSLLIHSASWNETVAQQIIDAISLQNGNNKDLITRFLGYGNINADRIFECTDKRVTLIGYGSLKAENAHLFKLPIPAAISGSTLWRSLTVTLAWFSPVNSLNQTYRQAKLWFDFPNKAHENILNISRKYYDNDTVNRGTVQHEIFSGSRAAAFVEGTELPIRVNCKEDAPTLPQNQNIKYVLSVTLEVAPELQTDIYNDVKIRIRPRIAVT